MRSNDYMRLVNERADARDGRILLNNSAEHVANIVERLISDAQTSVSILSRNLNAHVYGCDGVLKHAHHFLEHSKGRIRILLENQDTYSDNPFLNAFGHFHRQEKRDGDEKRLEVRFVPLSKQARYNFHLLVSDQESYRFEPDKSKIEAIVSFGDKKGAAHLESLFRRVWRWGVPYHSTDQT